MKFRFFSNFSIVFIGSCTVDHNSSKMMKDEDYSPIRQEMRAACDKVEAAIANEEYSRSVYNDTSDVLKVMKKYTDNFEPEGLEKATLIVGYTNAGKSSLCNYIVAEENLILTPDKKLAVKEGGVCITPIGGGKSSTTIFPLICKLDVGVLVDCAGEGDNAGTIAKAINSLIKYKFAKKIQELRILLVASQVSLGSEAGCGALFKKAFDINSEFLKDISLFKNSTGMVITCAEKDDDEDDPDPLFALKKAEKELLNIVNSVGSSSAAAYSTIIKSVIDNKTIRTFLKASGKPGTLYKEPKIHPTQRKDILEMISKLPYTAIPDKNFFNIPFDNEVKEVMQSVLEIIKHRVAEEIVDIFKSNTTITLYTIELDMFIQYLEMLEKSFATDILTFFKFLNWNNYFKIVKNETTILELADELEYVYQFINPDLHGKEGERRVKVNWMFIEGVNCLDQLSKYRSDANLIKNERDYVISPMQKGSILTILISDEAQKLSTEIANLKTLYTSHKTVEDAKDDVTSKYYSEVEKEVVTGQVSKTRQKFTGRYNRVKDGYTVERYFEQEKVRDEIVYKTEVKKEKLYFCANVWRNENQVVAEHSSFSTLYATSNSGCNEYSTYPNFYKYNGNCSVNCFYDKDKNSCYQSEFIEFECIHGGNHRIWCPLSWFNMDMQLAKANAGLPRGTITHKNADVFTLLLKHTNQKVAEHEIKIDTGERKPIYESKERTRNVDKYKEDPIFEPENYLEDIKAKQKVKEFNATLHKQDLDSASLNITNKKAAVDAIIAKSDLKSPNHRFFNLFQKLESKEDIDKKVLEYSKIVLNIEANSFAQLGSKSFDAVGI